MAQKILYFDCFSGISGDMVIAALVDIGVPQEYLIHELEKLNLTGYLIKFIPDERNSIYGLRADVIIENEHDNDHSQEHQHLNKHDHSHGYTHRSFSDISKIIKSSSLTDSVKELSISIFKKVAEAESKIHNKLLDEVHFHEIGAIDSIVDIVGAAICIDYLKPDRILSSTVELGGGFVKCRHGVIPVPAPATLEILKDVPVKSGAVQFETTTPTGAAILASCVHEFTDNKSFSINKISYGIGHRKLEIPNVLRVILAEGIDSPVNTTKAIIIECNIDDMNSEIYGYLMDKLLEAGASDVYYTPIIMKKGRPAVKISVLISPDKEQQISEILIKETTTFGYRKIDVEKKYLNRILQKQQTSFGEINVKFALDNEKKIKAKPEFEDLKRIALKTGLPLIEVYNKILSEINKP
jgi:uncharacterized protein (TIGR00299 family) protein